MSRKIWTVDEILNVLLALAMGGFDKRTLAAVARALGVRWEE